MDAWTINDVVRYMKSELASLRAQRTKQQIELNCLSKEIDSLEDKIFKIERECKIET